MGMPSKRQWKWIFMAVLAILILIVIFQNTDPQTTYILFVEVTMPRVVLLFITLVVGVILGILGDRYLLKK
jgi:uncharacterized integral membrane protein